jgi:lysophospholipase L1-like esterase
MLWRRFGTPTAFSPSAQGCAERATLGVSCNLETTLKGLHRASRRVLQPFQGWGRFAIGPRVASHARQPWAALQNAVGVQLLAAVLVAWWLIPGSALAQANAITVHMIGDSTMANKPVIPANPERGWGQMFQLYFKDSVRVENYAQNGRSSKSFIAEGRWDKVRSALQPGDFVIIQFGHNDEKTNDVKRGTAPFGEYTTNLVRFIRETREHKANPILATPTARRKFDESGTLTNSHGAYPEAVRKVAAAEKVPLLELTTATEKLLQQLGPESSKRWFDWIPAGEFAADAKKLEDDTHFNAYGASRVCDLAAVEIEAKVPGLASYLNRSSKSTKPVMPALER